eukprot:gene15025-biopygen204
MLQWHTTLRRPDICAEHLGNATCAQPPAGSTKCTLGNLGKAWESLGAPELRKSVKPWKPRGKPLEEPGNVFLEHLGRGQAAGRPGADKGKHEGSTMVGRALAKPWHRIWETLEDVGKRLEDVGKPWKTLEDLGKPSDRSAADFWMNAAEPHAIRHSPTSGGSFVVPWRNRTKASVRIVKGDGDRERPPFPPRRPPAPRQVPHGWPAPSPPLLTPSASGPRVPEGPNTTGRARSAAERAIGRLSAKARMKCICGNGFCIL